MLLSHVVPGLVMSGDVTDDMTTESAGGGQLRANCYLKSDYYDVRATVAKYVISASIYFRAL